MKEHNYNKQFAKKTYLGTQSSHGGSWCHNGDNGKANDNIEGIIKKLAGIITSEKFKKFRGTREENPKEFISQFSEIEGEKTSEQLYKNIRTKLEFKALSWFEAKEGFEIADLESFKKELKDEYLLAEEADDNEKSSWEQILKGPSFQDIVTYIDEFMKLSRREDKKLIHAIKNHGAYKQ